MNQLNTRDIALQQSADPHEAGLLGPSDPAPVDVCHAKSPSPFLLLCEHAGQAIPKALNGLGLAAGAIDRHIGWDIGAEALARAISDRLQCPLIIQRYSRLVMDCNRPPLSEGSIPEVSDSVPVPGNSGLTARDHDLRHRAIFEPMTAALTSAFHAHPRKAAFSIHSYTRQLQGHVRPWDAGFLTRYDEPAAQRLMSTIRRATPELRLALNEPYQIDDDSDWFIPRFAEPRGLRHTLIEVRNDHLRDAAGVARWADLLAPALISVLEESS